MVAGKSVPAGRPAKCPAFVRTLDRKPKRRLYEVLRGQGMQDNQQVTFLTDGGEDIRDLPLYLNPRAEHLLDWFHITMRLTVLRQMTKSLPATYGADASAVVSVAKADDELTRAKWLLWHGVASHVFLGLELVATLRAAALGQSAVAAIFGIFSGFWLGYAALLVGLAHGWWG